jgi:hypothetical protein
MLARAMKKGDKTGMRLHLRQPMQVKPGLWLNFALPQPTQCSAI